MATRRIYVRLPADLATRCIDAGEKIVRIMANPQTRADAMCAALTTHGAERNPLVQADAKAAEVAMCLWAGFDPMYSVRWLHADSGYDVAWFTVRIDVKQTRHYYGRLIWSIGRNDLLASGKKDFDVMVLACGTIPEFDLCGWITKHKFLANHRVADGSNGLTKGTWFMEQDELREMDELPAAVEWMRDNDPNVIMRNEGLRS